MKRLTIAATSLIMIGCSTAQIKAERYQEAFANFINPTVIKICYVRENGNMKGAEYRCFGNGCKLPNCPDEEK